jgi:hypothetical protein
MLVSPELQHAVEAMVIPLDVVIVVGFHADLWLCSIVRADTVEAKVLLSMKVVLEHGNLQ